MNSNKNCSKVMSLMTFSRFDADQAQHNADHATPFFIESNCLPLRSLFFQQLSYLMYDVHDKTDPKSLLDKFAKTNTKHHYKTQLSAKECFSVKFSRTEKMKKSFTRIGVSIWNSIPLSVKTLNISNFRKKIKLLNS